MQELGSFEHEFLLKIVTFFFSSLSQMGSWIMTLLVISWETHSSHNISYFSSCSCTISDSEDWGRVVWQLKYRIFRTWKGSFVSRTLSGRLKQTDIFCSDVHLPWLSGEVRSLWGGYQTLYESPWCHSFTDSSMLGNTSKHDHILPFLLGVYWSFRESFLSFSKGWNWDIY